MPVFAYRGRGARGELVTGTLEAADAGAVADQLLNTGVTPVDIKATATVAADPDAPGWLAHLLEPRVTLVDVMLFSRQMYTLLKAGVPIMRALAGLQESAINPTLRRVIADLRTNLDAGRELSSAMRRHPDVFVGFYISVVRVGETTGQLDEAFNRLFGYLEFERDVRDRIKTALRYPTIVMFVVAAAIGIVNFAVIPAFAIASRAGVPIVQALTVVASVVDNAYLARRVEQMREGVERGESVLRTAVTTGVFTPVVLQMIAVGEETGELDDLLNEVADMYEREVDYEIKNLAANLEPIITIVLGVLVLILALGVFLPIWELGKVMLKK